MGLEIVSQKSSNTYHPAANPINLTVNSSNNGSCNYRYICDIYVNNTRVFRDKLFPDPGTGYGFFQINRIVEDYITNVIPSPSTEPVQNAGIPTGIVSVYCKFGEEYDSTSDCSGNVSQTLNLATTNTFYVLNAGMDYEVFPSWSYTDYLIGTASSTTKKFLTNSQRDIEVTYNDSYYLDFILHTGLDSTFAWQIDIYFKDNTIDQVLLIQPLSATDKKRYRMACGPYDIIKLEGPVINQFHSKYVVKLVHTSNAGFTWDPISESFTFKLKDPKAFQTRIGFIGLLGGIENFTFYHRNKKSFDISRKQFNKVLQSNHSGSWNYAVGDRMGTVYGVDAQEKHAVNTYCDVKTSNWLYELWLSSNAWVYKRAEIQEFNVLKEVDDHIGPWIPANAKMYFYFKEGHGMKVGDSFVCLPDNLASNNDYNDIFTITEVADNRIWCSGMIYGVYNSTTSLHGRFYKVENWSRLPIMINDANVEQKERTSKPIEYSLNYSMSYNKTTLR